MDSEGRRCGVTSWRVKWTYVKNASLDGNQPRDSIVKSIVMRLANEKFQGFRPFVYNPLANSDIKSGSRIL